MNTEMYHRLHLTPLELCRFSLGDDRAIARIVGVSRGQTVQLWGCDIPNRHMRTLIEASARAGRFPLTAHMLIYGGTVTVEGYDLGTIEHDREQDAA